MLRLANLSMPPDYTEDSLGAAVVKKCAVPADHLLSLQVVHRSVDARDKANVHFVLTVHLKVKNEPLLLKKCRFLSQVAGTPSLSLPSADFSAPPLVVGAGPIGCCHAMMLHMAGAVVAMNDISSSRLAQVKEKLPFVGFF